MKIQIKDKDIELKYSFRAMMVFEEITGNSFSFKGVKDLIIYFYCTIVASDKDLDLDFDYFMDWLDSNPEELNNFTEWVVSHNKKNTYIRQNQETDEGDGEIKKNNK